MRPHLLIFLFHLLTFHSKAQCVMRATLTLNPVFGPATFVIGDKAYFACGWFTGTEGLDKQATFVYNSTTDSWSAVRNFPASAMWSAVGFAIGNKGYVTLGHMTNVGWYNDLWEYNALTDLWEQKSSVPAPGREFPISFSLNGKGYVGTGRHPLYPETSTDLWEYDPAADKWSKMPDVPGPGRMQATAFTAQGKAYVGMGHSVAYPNSKFSDFYEFDPLAKAWTKLADAPFSVNYAASFGIKDRGYVYCQSVGFWEYEPVTDTWAQLETCVTHSGSGMTGFSIYDRGYFAFGSIGPSWHQPNQLFEYTPGYLSGIDEQQKRGLVVFPNPAGEVIQISEPFDGQVRIFDAKGREVKSYEDAGPEIPVADLAPGLYHLLIGDGQRVRSGRFIRW